METKNRTIEQTIFTTPLIYIITLGLGLLLILAFYWFAERDIFYLFDDYITIKVNDTYKIDAKAKRSIKELNWYVENPEIATIDDEGNIHAKSLGKTKIIVKSKYHLFERSIDLNVSNFTVYSIVFEQENLTMNPKDEEILVPVLNNDANIKTNLEWKSSDDNIVTVTDTGRIQAISSGNAIITATDKYTSLSTSMEVNVKGDKKEETELVFAEEATDILEKDIISVASIQLNTNHLDMYVGSRRKLSSVVLPRDATDQQLIYSSSDNNIASVDSQGMITAKAQGICNIFVTSSDLSVSTSMIVRVIGKKVDVTGLSIEEQTLKLDINESYILTPLIQPANATNQKVIFTSSDSSVATVTDDGKVNAINKGIATIVAISEDSGFIDYITVEVSDKEVEIQNLSSFSFTGFKSTMIVGETNKIRVEAITSNHHSVRVNLTSSSRDVATIDQEGNIKAIAPGMVYIELETTDGSYREQRSLVVLPGDIEAELIYINRSNLQLKTGEPYKLVATVIPEKAENKEVIWQSSNPNVATVDDKGNVVAKSSGTTTIIARVKNTGITKSTKVAVVARESLIDVRKQTLTPYYANVKVFDENTKTGRAIQNFAIANIGTNSENIYFSFPTRSNIPAGTKITSDLNKAVMRTVIVKIPKNTIYSPSSKNRQYMYLNSSGHGQSLDLDRDSSYVWSNGSGYVEKDSNGVSWGNNRQLVKVKFQKNKIKSSYKPQRNIVIRNNNITYNNPELSFDWENNLAAVRSGRQVFIYNATDFVNGKLSLLYNFSLVNKAIDGTNYSLQGHDVSNGYYYQYRGYIGTKLYIEAYNFVGELQYTYIFNPKLSRQEAEGLKIYNNHIYVNISTACNDCSGRMNNIYFFK